MPEIQEPLLDFHPRVVFACAVDENGYLPTHNVKFSHPQGPDPDVSAPVFVNGWHWGGFRMGFRV